MNRAGPRRLVVVGDVLLDRDIDGDAERLAPDAPVPVVRDPTETLRPGGAGLAAALAASKDTAVTLVTPVAADSAGRRLTALLDEARVTVRPLKTTGETGEKIRISARGRPLVRVDRGGKRTAPLNAGAPTREALEGADAVLVADYGRGTAADPEVREALRVAAAAGVPIVWDPHPRGAPPVASRLVTPNRDEARRWAARAASAPVDSSTVDSDDAAAGHDDADMGSELRLVCAWADVLRQRWGVPDVCVTLGRSGALLVGGDGTPLAVPAEALGRIADPCGAGDRFASAAAVALGHGALPSEAVIDAVRQATAFVAAGGAAAFLLQNRVAARDELGTTTPGKRHHVARPPAVPDGRDAYAVVDRVRAAGGTVVATGGCFDLVHAGHVQMLAAARGLGDALIVCLNSDASVRLLKGPSRPVNSVADRAAVLSGLSCVDAVITFEEATPEAVLDQLRPDIWVKGADYAVGDLPEAPLLASWGGQALVLPYLAGRSTTTIFEEVRRGH